DNIYNKKLHFIKGILATITNPEPSVLNSKLLELILTASSNVKYGNTLAIASKSFSLINFLTVSVRNSAETCIGEIVIIKCLLILPLAYISCHLLRQPYRHMMTSF